MTRETKIGMVVASTFVCLLSVVVVSKLRPAEPPLEGEPQQEPPKAVAQAPPSKPAAPQKVEPKTIAPPPKLSIGSAPAQKLPSPQTEPKALVPPPPLEPAPTTDPLVPAPVANKQVEPPPTPSLIEPPSLPAAFGAVATTPAPAITPMPPAPVEPKPFGPLPEPQTPSTVAKGATGPPMPQLPSPIPLPVPLPTAEPAAPVELPKPLVKKEMPTEPAMPAPPASLEGSGPTITFPGPTSPMPEKPAATVVAPLPLPPPVTIGQPMPEPKTDPLAMPKVPSPTPEAPKTLVVKDMPAVPPPLTTSRPPDPAPKKIGTIGMPVKDVVDLPTVISPAGTSRASVPALTASGRELPRVSTHTDGVHVTNASDTSFAQLSQNLYGTPKYATALLQYNRQHVLNRSATNLQRDPPILRPNQAIYYPPPSVLASQYGQSIASVPAIGAALPAVQISPPMPLASGSTPPTADPTITYTVRETQHVFALAQQTLGNGSQWTEILRLNPSLRTDQPIPAGTQLRLPAAARVN